MPQPVASQPYFNCSIAWYNNILDNSVPTNSKKDIEEYIAELNH